MNQPTVTLSVPCTTCRRPRAMFCPCGCGLETPFDVCPRCEPRQAKLLSKTLPVRVCGRYTRAKLGVA